MQVLIKGIQLIYLVGNAGIKGNGVRISMRKVPDTPLEIAEISIQGTEIAEISILGTETIYEENGGPDDLPMQMIGMLLTSLS